MPGASGTIPGAMQPAGRRGSAPDPRPSRAPGTQSGARHRVQNLLLSLGVGLLLAVAAVIFLVVSWSVLGVGGRAAVMLGCTALAALGARQASRKALTATAEAVALLAVGLALLDAWGARNAGLAGLTASTGRSTWAGACATVAALAATFARTVPARALRVLRPPCSRCCPVRCWPSRSRTAPARRSPCVATGLVLTAAAELASVARWPFGPATRDARLVLVVGGAATYAAAALTALGAAYTEPGALVPGVLLLLVLAGGAALASATLPALESPGSVVATGLVVAAAWAPFAVEAAPAWAPVGMAAAVAALLALAALLPAARRRGSGGDPGGPAAAPALTAAEPLAAVVAGQLGWLDNPWSSPGRGDAFELLDRAALEVSPDRWGAEVPLLLLVVAAALGSLRWCTVG